MGIHGLRFSKTDTRKTPRVAFHGSCNGWSNTGRSSEHGPAMLALQNEGLIGFGLLPRLKHGGRVRFLTQYVESHG